MSIRVQTGERSGNITKIYTWALFKREHNWDIVYMVFTSTVIMKQSECPSMGGDELNPGLAQPCPVENHHIGLHLN